MINQGLKSYTKQISGNVGRISYHVNPNKECANLILDIPLISKKADRKVGLSLLYNHQNKSVDSKFGLGFKSSYDMKITLNNTYLSLTMADCTYSFIKKTSDNEDKLIIYFDVNDDGYYSEDEKIEINTDKYEVYTNNELGFTINMVESLIDNKYKYQLVDKSHTSYYFDDSGNLLRIITLKGDDINITSTEITNSFSKIINTISNNKVTNVSSYNTVTRDGEEEELQNSRIDLAYSNNKLTTITIYHNTKIVEKYQITYLDNYITIFDRIVLLFL